MRLFERNSLDHGRHARQDTEAKVASPTAGGPVRAPSSRRVPKMRSLLDTSMGSGPTPRTISTPPGRKPLKMVATVLPPEAVARITVAPPSACRAAAGFCRGAIDEVVCPELLRERFFVGAAGNGCNLEAHVPGGPHAKMSQPADAEHRNKVARLRRGISESAERRQPRAQ